MLNKGNDMNDKSIEPVEPGSRVVRLESLHPDAQMASRTRSMIKRQTLDAVLGLLESYDARDSHGFAFVIAQVAANVADQASIAHTVGVSTASVGRWATRASIPPFFSRSAAIAALICMIRNGPARTEEEKSALYRAIRLRVARELDNPSPLRALTCKPHFSDVRTRF